MPKLHHSSDAVTADLRIRVRLGGGVAIGPGKIELLEAIVAGGSIAAASRRTRMSYQRAWTLVDELNRGFREPLVEISRGGSARGGASVTSLGRDVIDLYRAIEREATEKTADAIASLVALRVESVPLSPPR